MFFCISVAGSSPNVCADTFAGPYALSEPEARAIVNFTTNYPKTINSYISFHAYSQLFMFPWGYTEEEIGNHNQLVCFLSVTFTVNKVS